MADVSTINANVAECLKSMSHVGFTRVHNLCTGTVTDVPWGAGDWILGGTLLGFIAACALIMLALAAMILSDVWG